MEDDAEPAQCILCLTDACDRPESELFIGLHRAGYQVDVMCNPRGWFYGAMEEAGLYVTPMSLRGRFDRKGTALIRRQLESRHYDILHAYNPRALACGLRASSGHAVRVVAYRGVSGNISFLNPESWMTFLHPRVDRIVAVCDAVRDYLASVHFLGLRIPPRKLVRIYKGHDLAWYRETPADLSEFGIPENAFVVCATGRDRPRKGFDVLLRAAALCPRELNIHFLLVGDMDRNTKLRELAERSVGNDRVHFPGYRRDAPRLAAASNAFVLASTEREGLPRAVIEAMAYAIPPIVSDVGGMPELVAHGESGYVVPRGDAGALARMICALATNPATAGVMGQRSRERIHDHFHTSQTVAQTLSLYRDLMTDSKAGATQGLAE